jgi:hypothetical protein
MREMRNARIDMQSIPVGSGIGAAVLIAMLLGTMFFSLPRLQPVAVWSAAVGVVFGVALIGWRRWRHE